MTYIQSLHHLRKSLTDYDLSCFDLATGTGASLSTGLVTDLSSSSVQLSGDAVFPCSSQVCSLVGQTLGLFPCLHLVHVRGHCWLM